VIVPTSSSAGPRGLSAGYLLAKEGKKVIVFEAEDQVGGIAKTVVDPEGFRFDLGGHRFFTKSKEVNDLWLEIMGDEFLMRPRMSRIFWRGKYLDYPLNGMDVVRKLGPWELMLCGLSYLRASMQPKGNEENLEQWVTNRFGWRLYSHFFKGYTEKVWGVSTTELRASGRPSGSRACRSGRPPRPPSSATRARSSRSSTSSSTPATARARCGR
jgi:protoporphyrinogen oxidase